MGSLSKGTAAACFGEAFRAGISCTAFEYWHSFFLFSSLSASRSHSEEVAAAALISTVSDITKWYINLSHVIWRLLCTWFPKIGPSPPQALPTCLAYVSGAAS